MFYLFPNFMKSSFRISTFAMKSLRSIVVVCSKYLTLPQSNLELYLFPVNKTGHNQGHQSWGNEWGEGGEGGGGHLKSNPKKNSPKLLQFTPIMCVPSLLSGIKNLNKLSLAKSKKFTLAVRPVIFVLHLVLATLTLPFVRVYTCSFLTGENDRQ